MDKNKKIPLSFAQIENVVVNNIMHPDERESSRFGWVVWGTDNKWPNYCYDLYNNVATLKSIIDTTMNYIIGDGVTSNIPQLTDNQAKKLAETIAFDILIYGGCALNVLRNRMGQVARADALDMRCVRSNKNNSEFYYSEAFRDRKTWNSKINVTHFASFDKENVNEVSSIYLYKPQRYQTYPTPLWGSVTIPCEIERQLDSYHLNSLVNGFSSQIILNMCNGIPSDEQKTEIERGFQEKYSGGENAGRLTIAYCEDRDHSPFFETVEEKSFADKYKELVKRTQSQIYTAFRCSPMLLGIAQEGIGFNVQEYSSAFKLFQRTVIQPLQQEVCEIVDDIFGEGSITISPFTIDFDGNKQDVEEIESNDVTVEDNE